MRKGRWFSRNALISPCNFKSYAVLVGQGHHLLFSGHQMRVHTLPARTDPHLRHGQSEIVDGSAVAKTPLDSGDLFVKPTLAGNKRGVHVVKAGPERLG